jgi:ligand-binding sensor domain-containing protein/signal transduction histidine kinase
MDFMSRRFKCSTGVHSRKIFACTAIVWILFFNFNLSGRTNLPLPDFSSSSWQTEQGLPQNSVTSIVQDRDGYLWLGTYNGLVRFDGVRFKVFDTGNTPEFGDSRITSLFEGADGTLWIGHETGGLTKLYHGTFSVVNLPGTWPGGVIAAIGTDIDGVLWLLNNDGVLFSLDGKKLFAANVGPQSSLPSLARDENGALWVVRGGLIGSLRKGKLEPWLPGGRPDVRDVQRAFADKDGGLWLLGEGRVMKWTGRGQVSDLGPAPWGQDFVTALLETKSGNLFVGTLQEGLFLWSPDGTYRQFNRQSGLSHDWVRCLSEDREGNVWVGTGGGGLNELRPRKVEMVKASDNWQGRAVLSVTTNAQGGLWIGTEAAGLYQFDGGAAGPLTATNGLSNRFIWSLLEDRQRNLWVGTWGKGLFVRKKSFFQSLTNATDPAEAVLALYQDAQGAIWIGTQSGLVRYSDGKYTRFTRANGLVLPDVRAIVEDEETNLWFGMSGGGLGRLKDGRLAQFRKQDGLPSDFVWSLLAEKDGTLWVGTFGGGLCRLRQGKFATISTRQGLPNNVICHIAEDGRGNFWISSYGGIFRVRKDELNRCADGMLAAVHCVVYDEADGLDTLECSGGFQPSGCSTADGRLWFPTLKGLAVINPADMKINPYRPPVFIEEVTVDDQVVPIPQPDISPASQIRIPPGKHRLEFHYTGLSLVSPGKVRFKYRLDGLEPDWVDAGTRRVAYYSYLKPGNYKFRVIACNNDGVWNEDGATLALTVAPWFLQTWWFISGGVLAGIAAVGGVVRYVTRRRLRRKMEHLKRQRALEKERARIARDIHDDLGASLTRIMLLSQSGRAELEDSHQAATHLEKIYSTARELTSAMGEIVWAVSPHHDTLDSLVSYLGKYAQDFLSAANIRCRLDLPIQLPAWPLTAEVRHNLFLAFKEALNNVTRHGAAAEVRISLEFTPSGFSLLIEDDGMGFDPRNVGAVAPANNPLRILPGNGLTNMRKRIGEIGGKFQIDSRPGGGTRVKFVVGRNCRSA